MGKHWYVVQTHPAKEFTAERELLKRAEERGVEVLLPRALDRRPLPPRARFAGGRTGFFTWKGPLFPCYLFVRFDPEEEWLWIEDLFGVARVIRHDERPVPVRPAAIERLTAALEAGGGVVRLGSCEEGRRNRRRFEKGQVLRVEEGPLTGYAGPYVGEKPGSVTLDLDIFGRCVRVELPEALVTAA